MGLPDPACRYASAPTATSAGLEGDGAGLGQGNGSGAGRPRGRAPGRSARARRGCAGAAFPGCSGRGSAPCGGRGRARRRSPCTTCRSRRVEHLDLTRGELRHRPRTPSAGAAAGSCAALVGLRGHPAELAEHETGEAGSEDGLAPGRGAHGVDDLLRGGRLHGVAGGPGLDRRQHVVLLTARREDEHPGGQVPDRPAHLVAPHPREVEVEHEHVRAGGPDRRTVAGPSVAVATTRKPWATRSLEGRQPQGVVVGHEDGRRFVVAHRRSGAGRGTVIRTMHPPPGRVVGRAAEVLDPTPHEVLTPIRPRSDAVRRSASSAPDPLSRIVRSMPASLLEKDPGPSTGSGVLATLSSAAATVRPPRSRGGRRRRPGAPARTPRRPGPRAR